MVSRFSIVMARFPAEASPVSMGSKKGPIGWRTPAISFRSIAMPTSAEIKLFDADFDRHPYVPGNDRFVVSPENSRDRLRSFLKGARRELLIYDPQLTDDAMLKLIAEKQQSGVEVVAAPEKLLHVEAEDLARIAYHLGNRHVPVQLGAGFLRLAEDHVLEHMLEHLGATVTRVEAPFEPEGGAYHQHDEMGHGGRIHDHHGHAHSH